MKKRGNAGCMRPRWDLVEGNEKCPRFGKGVIIL